jgi:hypothetical protein
VKNPVLLKEDAMKRKKAAQAVKAATPVDLWDDAGPVRWRDNTAYFAEDPTGLEQLWYSGSVDVAEGEAAVIPGWFSVDNLYFGDMELTLMPVQTKVRPSRSAAPRRIERFSLFYQPDSCFRYAIPE